MQYILNHLTHNAIHSGNLSPQANQGTIVGVLDAKGFELSFNEQSNAFEWLNPFSKHIVDLNTFTQSSQIVALDMIQSMVDKVDYDTKHNLIRIKHMVKHLNPTTIQ